MIDFPQNPTTITTLSENGRQLWRIEHPAMDGPMHVDLTRLGDLTGAGAARYREARDRTDGAIGSVLIEALVERRGLPERRAEWIVDAWECHMRGEDPHPLVEANANG